MKEQKKLGRRKFKQINKSIFNKKKKQQKLLNFKIKFKEK